MLLDVADILRLARLNSRHHFNSFGQLQRRTMCFVDTLFVRQLGSAWLALAETIDCGAVRGSLWP